MADLGSVALIAVGLFVGLFSGAGGSFMVERTRHDRDLQRRGADVLGPIDRLLLIDAHPDRVEINVGPHTPEQLERLQQKASGQLEALSAIAIQLPQPGRDHAKELAVAVHNSLHFTGWLVHDLLNPRPGATSRRFATGLWRHTFRRWRSRRSWATTFAAWQHGGGRRCADRLDRRSSGFYAEPATRHPSNDRASSSVFSPSIQRPRRRRHQGRGSTGRAAVSG